MRILVTGGGGFVGRHLLPKLINDERHAVFAPSKSSFNLLCGNSVTEIVDMHHTYQFDALIHLAAVVDGLPGNIGHQGQFMYENLLMGMHVLEGAFRAEIPKVINLGSVCGYHDRGPKPFLEENYWYGLPHESNRGYGMAKRATIILGIEYARQYGMDITNLIPINLVGEYDVSTHVCVDIIRKFEAAQGAPVELWGTGRATRELCYAGDLADAIIKSLTASTGPWPINIGTGEEITIRALAETIKRLGGYQSTIVWDDTKPEGQHSRCLDISRAKQLLGWEPQTSLEDALKRTIEWNRKQQS